MREESKQINERDVDAPWLFLAGPLFLLCTVAIAASSGGQTNLYWLAAALVGMTLCAYYKLRGCVYAVALLALASVVKHGFFTTDHFWQFGLESSLACGLLITTLTLDQRKSIVQSLQETANTRGSAISNLEEELSKLMETSQSQQMFLQEKLAETQKEREDLQSEVSSILILNEVLRKTTARQTEDAERLAEGSLDKERRVGSLLDEIDALQKELARVSDLSGLAQENTNLLDELNMARSDRAQTHLINETLARLHAKEAQKAQEASEVSHALHAEKQMLQEELGAAKAEVNMLSTHLQQVSEELEKSLVSLEKMEALQVEKKFLQERLQTAEQELASAMQKMESYAHPPLAQENPAIRAEREALLEKLAEQEALLHKFQEKEIGLDKVTETEVLLDKLSEQETLLAQMEERLKTVVQTETLYKQLKAQFEEKNAVLHETRAKLFQADTQLQQLLIEKEQLSLHSEPIPVELQQEICALEQEVSDLREENDHLLQIVTSLSTGETRTPEKKN